ncbi:MULTISPECIES: maleylacetate reductase [unclassified Mycolicibacterium]|uniref:maleylacetate reductase n=1 Tax=unclassified Mycolicibacterium TaxID=2636767 RepID=UPI002EDAF3AA
MDFTHDTLPQRVIFATGGAAAAVASEITRLDARRVMLVAGESAADLADRIGELIPIAVRHSDIVMHVPVDSAERARAAATAHDADAILCIGGGSATGLAKAVALTIGLPIVAVPTTYAGSEATPMWGLTDNGRKTTGVDAAVLPRSVVYDATLLASLPADLAVASGLNALAHCIDAMWAPRADPIDRALAGEGIHALASGLPRVATDGIAGIEQTLYGAYLAATAFASAGSGMHHKICHVLGGMFNLPHAQTHSVVLPHVLAFNEPNAVDAAARIAAAFGSDTASTGLAQLRSAVDAPRALRDYGLAESDLPAAVDATLPVIPADNPTPVTPENLAALLHAAWEGDDPR